ncbi:hypothetical protein HUK80_09030 [Flavobacterium sp. MAH-1]|uniref:HTH hxlR-type domain-containing protein n=1 Tax=Flavobacterium agri TaxID=2743471 RepID=A0A7Y8Y4B7_9FLAO|nr:hypothetical protein [Flavobacterium agri]NUY81036.1 hypothetical protein [Flavobacterium agri]NYA71060.1 hypothetical protein [Flavobacterium agri]
MIKRTIIDDYPVRIVYKSEPYAATLNPIIFALKDWGLNHRRKLFEKGFVMELGEAPECLPVE